MTIKFGNPARHDVIALGEDLDTAGAIVWWRLSGSVKYDVIRQAWIDAGLDEKDLVKPCSERVALSRALRDVAEKRILIRPLPQHLTKGTVLQSSGASAVVYEHTDGGDLQHTTLFLVGLDKVGRPAFVDRADTLNQAMVDRSANKRAVIKRAFEAHSEELEAEDFSAWLVKTMPKLDALTLRQGGGIYFIPPSAMDDLRAVVDVLSANTKHILNRVPAMRSKDAVDAIINAVKEEADSSIEVLEKDILEAKVGSRGLQNRVQDCLGLEAKVERYEKMLGTQLTELQERLKLVRANLVTAAIKADAGEAAAE